MQEAAPASQFCYSKNMLFVGVLKINASAHQPALCASLPINGDTQNHMTLLIGASIHMELEQASMFLLGH